MAKPVEFLIGARIDFDESFDWYRRRSSDAAAGFVASVDAAIEMIKADPNRFVSTLHGCRYYALRRYPFRVVYRDEPDRLIIVAIAHTSRRPGYWATRI